MIISLKFDIISSKIYCDEKYVTTLKSDYPIYIPCNIFNLNVLYSRYILSFEIININVYILIAFLFTSKCNRYFYIFKVFAILSNGRYLGCTNYFSEY